MSAARTRSLASDTALSGKPTMLKAGRPGATCTDVDGAGLDAVEGDGADALDQENAPNPEPQELGRQPSGSASTRTFVERIRR